MIRCKIGLVLFLFLLTGCAGRITTAEYEYGRPVKVIEIRFVIAPAPAPVDAHPPGRGLVLEQALAGRRK